MEHITYRVIVVVGDNHDEIARKYSADLEGNDNAFYKYERCQQHRLEVTGEEGDFSDPFPLKDGSKSYSARYNEIDWGVIHHSAPKMEMAARVWELVMDDCEPENDYEKMVKHCMIRRKFYFENNFSSKEEYVQYYSSLWYYGIATDEMYDEVDTSSDESVMEWCTTFFDRYIKPLEDKNPLLTIYEVHSLD